MFETLNPRETVLITTRFEDNILGKDVLKDNVTAIDWHMPTSTDPPLYAISLRKDQYTAELIRKSKCFVVNVVGIEMAEKVAAIGAMLHGKHKDKIKGMKVSTIKKQKLEFIIQTLNKYGMLFESQPKGYSNVEMKSVHQKPVD